MLLPAASSDVAPPADPDNGDGRETEPITTALRQNYHDAVRLAAQEEILADLAEDVVTAQLHADTARFHHGSAHAYAKALDLLLGEDLSVIEDKQKAKKTTRDIDLAPMRCHARRYRASTRTDRDRHTGPGGSPADPTPMWSNQRPPTPSTGPPGVVPPAPGEGAG